MTAPNISNLILSRYLASAEQAAAEKVRIADETDEGWRAAAERAREHERVK